MKESLTQHIKSVLEAVDIGNLSFDVYECKTDTLPLFVNQIEMTHEFLVCADCSKIADDKREKMQRFISKEMYFIEKDNLHFLYWFEGDRIIDYVIPPNNTPEEPIEYLKANTCLPAWLDDFIFNRLGAQYAPDFQRFEYNLDLTEEECKKYLGTYFPRSYAEAFCIFDNIFQNEAYRNNTFNKTTLNILSIGCGTGGDILGLLTVIHKYNPLIGNINIWAMDGNKEALDILNKIIEKYRDHTTKKVKLNIVPQVFENLHSIDLTGVGINAVRFDFILSFKMICEIISNGCGAYDNSYYDFVKKFVPLLSESGVCILLDVTTKQGHSTFNPILMNRQVNRALRELPEYKTLLPLSCNLYGEGCNNGCFYQQRFFITHSKHSGDKSKVAYRVIAGKTFADTLAHPVSNVQYIINNSNNTKTCQYTIQHAEVADAYMLNK